MTPRHKPPESMDELNALTMSNMRITGYGLEVTQYFPCPFCAAPDWHAAKIINFAQSTEPITCVECGRSARFIYTSTGGGPLKGGSSGIELVQTGGDDPPDWMQPPPRREAA